MAAARAWDDHPEPCFDWGGQRVRYRNWRCWYWSRIWAALFWLALPFLLAGAFGWL